MPIEIRSADLESDRAALVELMRQALTPESDVERFEWLYRRGPHGAARAWLAVDGGTREPVGAAAAFPRRMWWDGKERSAFVLGDFCMLEKYRSLGPSLALQRACMNGIANGAEAFFYDFPSQGMMAVYKRLGIAPAGELVRWALPLRSGAKLEALTRSKKVARGLAPLADFALAKRGWKGSKSACDVSLQQGRCSDEFTALDQETRSLRGLRTARTADYLNWRYLAHPSVRHEIFAARKAGKLIGYAVCAAAGDEAIIADLNCADSAEVVARLLHAAAAHFRKRGASTISLHAGARHPWNEVFARAGFRAREAAPIIVRSADGAMSAALAKGWFVMSGDRDS